MGVKIWDNKDLVKAYNKGIEDAKKEISTIPIMDYFCYSNRGSQESSNLLRKDIDDHLDSLKKKCVKHAKGEKQ